MDKDHGTYHVSLVLAGWWFGTTEFYDFADFGNFITPTD